MSLSRGEPAVGLPAPVRAERLFATLTGGPARRFGTWRCFPTPTKRGVTFADYDLPGLNTVDHVCILGSEKAAWFQDPAGNVLCLHEAGHDGSSSR